MIFSRLLPQKMSHVFDPSLGGAGDKINLMPQASTLNRQDWRDMERFFERELKAGKIVMWKLMWVSSRCSG